MIVNTAVAASATRAVVLFASGSASERGAGRADLGAGEDRPARGRPERVVVEEGVVAALEDQVVLAGGNRAGEQRRSRVDLPVGAGDDVVDERAGPGRVVVQERHRVRGQTLEGDLVLPRNV